MTVPPWIPRLETYLTTAAQSPVQLRCDEAAIEHIPVKSHALRLTLHITVRAPQTDGLPTQVESDEIARMQERLAAMVGYDLEAWHVGDITTGGTSQLILYAPAPLDEAKLATCIDECRGPYTITHRVEKDPKWRFYSEQLWPSRKMQQHRTNHQTLAQLRELGDNPTRPRAVIHTGFFDREADAKTGATALQQRGFELTSPEPTEFGSWRLEFTNVQPLTHESIDRTTDEILSLFEEIDGEYDGWTSNTVVVPANAGPS